MLNLPEKYCNSFQQKNYIVDIIAKTWNELSWKELNWINGKVHLDLNWIVNLQLGFSQLNKEFFNMVTKLSFQRDIIWLEDQNSVEKSKECGKGTKRDICNSWRLSFNDQIFQTYYTRRECRSTRVVSLAQVPWTQRCIWNKTPFILFFHTTANCPTLPFDSSTAKDPGTPLNANPELADLETIGSVFAGLLLSEVRSLIM